MRRAATTVLAAGLMTPATAAADTPAGEPIEVTVRAPAKQPRTFGSTRSATVTQADELERNQPGSLADALRGTPGVSVQQTTPGQGTVFLRGFSGREVVHLVDGVRLNATIFRAGNNPYLGLVDPWSFKEVEVLRGSASVVHGSDALGGVVAMETWVPALSLGGDRKESSVMIAGASNPAGWTTRAEASHSGDKTAVHIGVTLQRVGDVRPGGGERSPVPSSFVGATRAAAGNYGPEWSSAQRGTGYDAAFVDATGRVQLGETLSVTLRNQLGFRPELIRYDEVSPRFKRATPSRADSAVAPMARLMNSATLANRTPDRTDLLVVAWQRLYEGIRRRDLAERCLEGGDVDACQGTVALEPSRTLRRERNISDAYSLRAESRFGRARSERGGVIGVDFVHDRVTSHSWLESGTARTPDASRFPTGSSQTQAGVFGQLEARPVPWLLATLGLRGSLFALSITSRPADLGNSPSAELTLIAYAAQLGLRAEASEEVAFMANAGRAVRAPNVQDLATLGPRAGGRFQLANPELRPEEALSFDVGVKASPGPVRIETFVFATRLQNAIAPLPTTLDGRTANENGETYVRSVNAVRVDIYGIEADLLVRHGEHSGTYLRGLAMLGTQTNPDGENPKTTPADRVPPAQATGGSYWGTEKVRLEGFARGRLRQARLNDPTNIDDNRIPEGGTPGFATLHVRASYAPSEAWAFQLGADNLTNAKALEHGSGYYLPGLSVMGAITGRLFADGQ